MLRDSLTQPLWKKEAHTHLLIWVTTAQERVSSRLECFVISATTITQQSRRASGRREGSDADANNCFHVADNKCASGHCNGRDHQLMLLFGFRHLLMHGVCHPSKFGCIAAHIWMGGLGHLSEASAI